MFIHPWGGGSINWRIGINKLRTSPTLNRSIFDSVRRVLLVVVGKGEAVLFHFFWLRKEKKEPPIEPFHEQYFHMQKATKRNNDLRLILIVYLIFFGTFLRLLLLLLPLNRRVLAATINDSRWSLTLTDWPAELIVGRLHLSPQSSIHWWGKEARTRVAMEIDGQEDVDGGRNRGKEVNCTITALCKRKNISRQSVSSKGGEWKRWRNFVDNQSYQKCVLKARKFA